MFLKVRLMMAGANLRNAMKRIMRPLVRTMIARGLTFPELSDLLKTVYVEECSTHFGLPGKRVTDSRLSLLTGLQRKDIRRLKSRVTMSATDDDQTGHGPIPRMIAYWLGSPKYTSKTGKPLPLKRTGEKISFETLVDEISRDIHPRTILDEMERRGLLRIDDQDDTVSLLVSEFIPSTDDIALLDYFSANLGDHAEAAAANLSVAPEPGQFFERAVHYDHLSYRSIDEIGSLARKLETDALAKINKKAVALQARDDCDQSATHRFRLGSYFYFSDTQPKQRD